MSEQDEDWLPAKKALSLLRCGGISRLSAATTVGRRAWAELLATKADKLMRGNECLGVDFALPKEFWWAQGHPAMSIDWTTGDIETSAERPSEPGWQAFGVKFSRTDLERLVGPAHAATNDKRDEANVFEPKADSNASAPSRAPAWKAGRAPRDAEILAKADEMKATGLNGRDIAARMHLENGFADVASTYVRELIAGRYLRTGAPKRAHKSA